MGAVVKPVAFRDFNLTEATTATQMRTRRPTQALVDAPAVDNQTLLSRLFRHAEHTDPLLAGPTKPQHLPILELVDELHIQTIIIF